MANFIVTVKLGTQGEMGDKGDAMTLPYFARQVKVFEHTATLADVHEWIGLQTYNCAVVEVSLALDDEDWGFQRARQQHQARTGLMLTTEQMVQPVPDYLAEIEMAYHESIETSVRDSNIEWLLAEVHRLRDQLAANDKAWREAFAMRSEGR